MLFAALSFFSLSVVAQEIDQHKVVYLSEAQRALVLKEMRNLLAGTKAIVSALPDDQGAVIES